MNDNVIQFPKPHRDDVECEEAIALALDIFEDVAIYLDEEGYDVEEMNNDLGTIVNLFVAALYRQQGKEHFLQEPLDAVYKGLEELMQNIGEEAPANDIN